MGEGEEAGSARRVDVSALPAEAARAAGPFFERVVEEAGEGLLSITVVGSAATPDFRPGLSDVNSCLVLDRIDIGLLERIAALGRKFGKKRIQAPLLMTPEYIERSLDVFPLEFLDFRAAHVVVYGKDFFGGLSFQADDVRLACERELKSLLIKAHRGYLAALNKTALLKGLVLETANAVLPVMRGLLFLENTDAPVTRAALVRRAADVLGVPAAPFESVFEIREGGAAPGFRELQEIFKDLYDAIEAASYKADRS